MKQLEVNAKNIMDPPEKMLKMYEAVMGLLQEERDMESLKVSDITIRAGIGKGTAYEYFSSKEELITSAMIWGIAAKIYELSDSMDEKEGFREKCFCIFEWLESYKEYAHVVLRMFRESFGERCCETGEQIAGNFVRSFQGYIYEKINEMMELGVQEGIFTVHDEEKQTLAFLGAVIQYSFVLMRPKKTLFLQMNREQLKEFVYSSMVKALNA